MAFNFKLPTFGKSKGEVSPGDTTVFGTTVVLESTAVKPSAKGPRFKLDLGGKSPLAALSHLPMIKQLQALGGVVMVLVAVGIVLVVRDDIRSRHGAIYESTAGEMRMLSQRIAKSTAQAMQGNPLAFTHLKDARDLYNELLQALRNGGELGENSVPASPEAVQEALDALVAEWSKVDKDIGIALDQERNLTRLGKEVTTLNSKNADLLKSAEQFATLRSGTHEITQAQQMVMLTQRIAKNANALLVGETIDAEIATTLEKDATAFRDLIAGFAIGSERLRLSAVSDDASNKRLAEVDRLFKSDLTAANGILTNIGKLVQAKQAGARIIENSEPLLGAADTLAKGYNDWGTKRTGFFLVLSVLITLILGLIALMAKLFFDDQARQAREVDGQRKASEAANRANQDAILRLMNELGDLADGDLTVNATVTEDVTGAIADSINYTIEELRVLVGRINDAANRVTQATEVAQQNTAELLAAAEQQSNEIQSAGQAALDMAHSMTQVSNHATQSAEVARQSLHAAEKGATAVQDSIKGMNEIRDQIQETSKRIKRLGESSQEIGEIVELISDITEQTNVLALNAAIQAASAGEAGRGFTVVAEEVQRLAERSAEATKQIAAIVKTIQTDTQDAVSAMEESTQGVVEGAKRSDAAGQALNEIGQVSRNLAQLIENISTATQTQAQSATGVAETMQHILHITEQTTAGTQKTASMVGELADLAAELKGSVAGFKVS